jgi:hypothetical protein
MEQTNQQITQKLTLPIKTKIAAWWMIIIGGLGAIACIIVVNFLLSQSCTAGVELPIILFLPSALGFLFGLFLLKIKKWAWVCSVVLFSLIIFLFLFIQINNFASAIDNCRKRYGPELQTKFCSIKSYLIDEWFKFLYWDVIFCAIFLIPPILLLLDRKNFWKIAK